MTTDVKGVENVTVTSSTGGVAWWIVALALVFVAVAVAAVSTDRRRSGSGEDAREDRFINPGRSRHKSMTDKQQEHGEFLG